MSWLYSIFFAGLVFSSGGNAVKQPGPINAVDKTPYVAIQGDEQEKLERSYPLTSNGRVSVSNVNGSITVEAWDKNEVYLEAIKIADTKEALADVQIKIDARPDSFSVETDYDDWRRRQNGWKNRGKLEVQYRLSVPRGAVLDEIETVNGSVRISNFVNISKASAVNGDVIASNLQGTANMSTVNGEVVADYERLETGSKVSLSTVNGRVNLTIPSDANATLKADSLNGDIRNDFGLPVRKGQFVGRDLYGRIGSGDVPIRLESVNGPLIVQRKNDGKVPNPSTDLLRQKSNDDDGDPDISGALRTNNDKLRTEIARAARDSAKAAEAGVAVALPELARLPAEIDKIKIESIARSEAALAKANLNKAELKRTIDEGFRREREALASLREIRWSGRNPMIEKKANTFPVKGTPKVTVDANGCSVVVRSWDRSEVRYVLTTVENRRGNPVAVEETVTPSSITLKVQNNDKASRDIFFDGSSDSVRLEVFVPRRSNVKVITNGEIRMDGVSGDIELDGVDETIDVRNSEGKLKVNAADGQVRVIGFTGELDSTIDDGDVYLEGNFSRITGSAADGRYILTVPENYNGDVTSNVDELMIEGLGIPTQITDGQWRFGVGGPKLSFMVAEGEVKFRGIQSLTN